MKNHLFKLHAAYQKHQPLQEYTDIGIIVPYGKAIYAITVCSCGHSFGYRGANALVTKKLGLICSTTCAAFMGDAYAKAPKDLKPALKAHIKRCKLGLVPRPTTATA